MMKLVLGAMVVVLCIGNVVHAEDHENSSLPLSRLYYKYDEFLKGNEDKAPNFKIVYNVNSKEVSPEDVVFRFKHNDEEVSFSPLASGLLEFYPDMEMLSADPLVSTNQPKGTLSVNVSAEISLQPQNLYEIDDLHDAAHDAWGVVQKFAGGMRVFAPKHTVLTVEFEDSCVDKSWMIKNKDKTVDSGTGIESAVIDFGKRKIRNAETISFNCVPERFLLG